MHGREAWLPEAEVVAEAQKSLAAGNLLESAKEVLSGARSQMSDVGDRMSDNGDPASDIRPASSDPYLALAQTLQLEDATAAGSRLKQTIESETARARQDASRQVRIENELAVSQKALAAFEQTHPELAADDFARDAITTQVQREINADLQAAVNQGILSDLPRTQDERNGLHTQLRAFGAQAARPIGDLFAAAGTKYQAWRGGTASSAPGVYGLETWGTAFGDIGDTRSDQTSRTRESLMPLRERSIVDQREEFVKLALAPGANKRELCRRFGISRSKGYKWIGRYLAQGRSGLADRSRRPHRSPTRTCDAVEAEVLRIREDSNQTWGGRKIAHVLKRDGAAAVPSPSTITQILRRHGKLEHRASAHPGAYQRFEREQPNELWQMDFKGHFATGRGRCHPLTIIDDHSRYALGVEACATQQDVPTRERLAMVFRRYGLPDAMLMDNGSPWGDSGGGGFTAFAVWLLRLGIRVAHGRAYHPQTQGKDERFNRTLGAEVLTNQHFRDLAQCQRAFDAWRHKYNHVRPHQALDLATPSERYRPSRRSFPEALPPIEYGPDDCVRKADQDGDISFQGRCIRLGKPFRGMPVALRPRADDGSFSVHFCTHQIAVVDRRGRIRPVDVWTSRRAMPTSPQAQQQQQRD